MKRIAASLALLVCSSPYAQESPDRNINNYLVDITGGVVSAAGLIEAQNMTITTIESSQDIIVALTPIASRDGSKKAFGLAITPAKTTLLPMAGQTYAGAWYMRLLGNLTFSYAQNQADYDSQAYKKMAFAISTLHYFRLDDDPVYQSSVAFKACADKTGDNFADRFKELNDRRLRGELTNEQFQKELEKLTNERETLLAPCMDEALAELAKARWNSPRMSLSYGEGRIRASGGGGPTHSLGKAFNLNAQYPLGSKGVAQLSLRHARDALDLDTLGATTQDFKSSRLAALRLTYGDQDDSSLRALVEASSSRSSSATAYKEAFIYAFGLDKKISRGTWLEFRVGRNRSVADGREQTAALLAINLAPTLFEFKK
jgi:hypothetical protein